MQRVTVRMADGTRTRTLMRFAAATVGTPPTVSFSLTTASTQSSRFVTGYPGGGITLTGGASDGSAVLITTGSGWPGGFTMTGTGPASVTWTSSAPAGTVTLPVTLHGTGAWADKSETTSAQLQIWPQLAASVAATACSPFRTRSSGQPCTLTLTADPATGSLGTWAIAGLTFEGSSSNISTSYATGSVSQNQTLVARVWPKGNPKQCTSGEQRTLTATVRDAFTGSTASVQQVVTC